QTAPAAPAAAQERARLLELQRAEVGHLRQAAREGAPADEVRRALSDASRDLDALGAEPAALPPEGGSRMNPLLPAPLRSDLRRASADLTALALGTAQGSGAATARILTLLDKVKSQLEGAVALGLTFEGSYSQSE